MQQLTIEQPQPSVQPIIYSKEHFPKMPHSDQKTETAAKRRLENARRAIRLADLTYTAS